MQVPRADSDIDIVWAGTDTVPVGGGILVSVNAYTGESRAGV